MAMRPNTLKMFPLAFCLDAMQAVPLDRSLQVPLRFVNSRTAAIISLHWRRGANHEKS